MKLIVESSRTLDPATQTEITAQAHRQLGSQTHLIFRTDPALIAGLRFIADGKVIDLSVKSRLTQLKQSLFS